MGTIGSDPQTLIIISLNRSPKIFHLFKLVSVLLTNMNTLHIYMVHLYMDISTIPFSLILLIQQVLCGGKADEEDQVPSHVNRTAYVVRTVMAL